MFIVLLLYRNTNVTKSSYVQTFSTFNLKFYEYESYPSDNKESSSNNKMGIIHFVHCCWWLGNKKKRRKTLPVLFITIVGIWNHIWKALSFILIAANLSFCASFSISFYFILFLYVFFVYAIFLLFFFWEDTQNWKIWLQTYTNNHKCAKSTNIIPFCIFSTIAISYIYFTYFDGWRYKFVATFQMYFICSLILKILYDICGVMDKYYVWGRIEQFFERFISILLDMPHNNCTFFIFE